MSTRPTGMVRVVATVRWSIPVVISLVGAGYILFELVVLNDNQLTDPHVIRSALVLALLGPILAWLTLTWAYRVALAEDTAQAELARLYEETRRQALQLEAASQASRRVTAILDLDQLISQVVRLIQETFGYYHVHLLLVDPDSRELVLREGIGEADASLKAQGFRLKIGQQSITGLAAARNEPVLSNDVTQDPLFFPHELLPRTLSELAVPLRIGENVLGVLDVQSDQREVFQPDDVRALQILADQVAIAIENARLFDTMRRQNQTLRALHDISLDLTSHLDTQQVLEIILVHATRFLSAEGSSLARYDRRAQQIHILANHNFPSRFEGLTLHPNEGAVGRVIQTEAPVIINDYKHWEGRSAHFADSPYDAIISVPLRWESQVMGALSVVDRGEERQFTSDDVQILSLFADMASIALKNADLYAEVVRLSQDLERKVEERTNELTTARKELAHKAEQLQRLLTQTLRVQEEERARIARDLHDGSNQLLTGTLFQIQAAQESLVAQRYTNVWSTLETAKTLLRDIEAENRRLISGLRPAILDAQGLTPALQWQARLYQEHFEIPCHLNIIGEPIRFRPEAEVAIFRIVQESLNNVVAHAHARSVKVRVVFSEVCLCVVIEDDGVGFDVARVLATPSDHLGLIGMRERAESLGGRLTVEALEGLGTRVTLHLPFANNCLERFTS